MNLLSLILNNIDLIALLLSLISIVYTYSQSAFRLKLKFKLDSKPFVENEHHNFIFNCYFSNRSKYPITISKIKLNGCEAFNSKLKLGDGSEPVLNQEVYGADYTQQIPFNLNLYEGLQSYILIRDRKPFKLRHINLLEVYTSRGIGYYLCFKKKL